jgi:THO complex subunit 5
MPCELALVCIRNNHENAWSLDFVGLAHEIHEEAKLEDEIQEEEDDSQRRRKRTRKSHIKEVLDGVYHAHPLSVLWHIFDDDDTDGNGKSNKLLTLRFEYLMKLKIVCAGVEGAEDVPLVLLTNLFPDDTGMELPTEVSFIYFSRFQMVQ